MILKILIADDHAFTLEGMQHALSREPGLTVCAAAKGGVEAVALARVHSPDIALLDYSMPGVDGLETAREIGRWSPQTKCVIVTATTESDLLLEISGNRIGGLFSKSCPISEIVAALPRIARGDRIVSPRIKDLLNPSQPLPDISLTEREQQVLAGIARGLTNGRIAQELSISPKTVESHRASVMRKLDVNSGAALVVEAIRRGLFAP